jgi:CRISPR-associated endonuclease Cas1
VSAAAVPASLTLTPEDVVDSMSALAETYSRSDLAGVCVADGFGVRVVVERGALEVHDGVGQHRRCRRFDRATHGLRRLVILNAAGMVSLDALRWCANLGVGVVVFGRDGSAELTSTPRMTDDARLRRTQALAPFEPYGLDVARWLMSRKIMGQGKLVLRRFGDSVTAETIGDLALATEGAATIDELRQLEASAAALYFGTWSGRPECTPTFAAKDRRRIPPHWSRYEGRRSVLASAASNRKAERPVNAMLNYLYSLVEAEGVLACQTVGLDPGLGIVHADAKGRQSLALDLMEPVRPEVDAFVLDMVERRTFRKADFTETADGHVRLLAPLTHELAETMPLWAKSLGPIAEYVATSSARPWPARTRRPRHSRPGAIAMRRRSRRRAKSRRLVVPLQAGCFSAQQLSRPLLRWDVSRLRRSGHEPSPRPLRGVYRRRPGALARDQGTARRSDRGSEASTHGVGQGESRHGLRPGAVPAGDPPEAQDRAAYRDHGRGRLLQGVRVRLPAWEADTARVDVGGARRACRRARALDVTSDGGCRSPHPVQPSFLPVA